MALSQSVTLDNDATANYIRIEFTYVMNTRGNKTVFARIGFYVSEKSTKAVEFKEYSRTFEELGYTGSENLFALIYAKIKEEFPQAIDC